MHGQRGVAGKADPVNVDPQHYKVEFENERVRVLRVSYGPGEKSVMHYNPDSVIVSLTGDKTRMTTPDGKSHEAPAKAGAAIWAPAGSRLQVIHRPGDACAQLGILPLGNSGNHS